MASLYEALVAVNTSKSYSGQRSSDAYGDAPLNEAVPIRITWSPSLPPLNSTCGN